MKGISRCAVLGLVLLAAACSDSKITGIPVAPDLTPPGALESFSGTLEPQGISLHTFTVAQTGNVQVTLIGVVPQLVPGPSAPITVGLGIGTPSGLGTCLVLYQVSAQPGTAAQIIGTATAGPDCITIFDVGNLTQPVNYTVTVAHS